MSFDILLLYTLNTVYYIKRSIKSTSYVVATWVVVCVGSRSKDTENNVIFSLGGIKTEIRPNKINHSSKGVVGVRFVLEVLLPLLNITLSVVS